MRIKSVKLLRDLPGCDYGTMGYPEPSDSENIKFSCREGEKEKFSWFSITLVQAYPDWFRVEYEEEEEKYYIEILCRSRSKLVGPANTSRFMSKKFCEELQKFLTAKMVEWFKSRCPDCGGEMALFDHVGNKYYPGQIIYTSDPSKQTIMKKCVRCGKMGGENDHR